MQEMIDRVNILEFKKWFIFLLLKYNIYKDVRGLAFKIFTLH